MVLLSGDQVADTPTEGRQHNPSQAREKTWNIHGVRAQMRENFPRDQYTKRSLIETVFSVAKRKLSCRAPGRTVATQVRQALLLGITYNLYRLWLHA